MQGAAAPQVVNDEVEFAHGLLAVLQLHPVRAQGEMGTGVEPCGDEGLEVLAQQLPGRIEDFRWKRLAAEGEFRGPSVKQGQVGIQGLTAPIVVEHLETQIGVPRHEGGGAYGPAQPHQCGQRPGLIGQSATPSFQPRVLHAAKFYLRARIPCVP